MVISLVNRISESNFESNYRKFSDPLGPVLSDALRFSFPRERENGRTNV